MAIFEYEALDLEKPTFRLIRLLRGDDGPIRCRLFEAWLDRLEDVMDYAALSYTWGSTEKPHEIMVNGSIMAITKNLYLALRHLRHPEQDRILWVDAICIDQENPKERGHQVEQMASIYNKAERVIIWLGEATNETDHVMHFMKQLDKQRAEHERNKHSISDQQWLDIWLPVIARWSHDQMFPRRNGLMSLLGRSWFKRVWILQEVANARAAEVVCGTESVSARIFALAPSFLGIIPNPHCQAVLDIMPGPSRKGSWWAGKHNLQTLLAKFGKSEASDPRDKIYALLGISSDARDTDLLRANYDKSPREVVRDTMSFLLKFHKSGCPIHVLPDWTMAEFLENLDSLSNALFKWAWENNGAIIELLVNCDGFDVNSKDDSGRTLLSWVTLRGVPLSRAASSRMPLSWAAEEELLLGCDGFDVNSKDDSGRTPLLWAASGKIPLSRAATIRTLQSRVDSSSMALSWAEEKGREAVVKLLLGRGDVDVNLKDNSGRTPLSWAAVTGHEAVVKLLLGRGDVDVNLKDDSGRTPLSRAAEEGHEAVVKLLLGRDDVDVNSKDNSGRTSLSWAASIRIPPGLSASKIMPLLRMARERHEAVAKLLLRCGDVDVNLKDDSGRTPLSWAAEEGHEAMVKLLLGCDDIDVNLKDNSSRTPLSWAIERRHEAVVKRLESWCAVRKVHGMLVKDILT